MYANTESRQPSQTEGYGTSRGRGQGGRSYWRARGRGRSGYNQNWYYNRGERDDSKVMCYRCDKLGHYASSCPDRLLKFQETTEKKDDDTQEADNLIMHEVVYLNEQKIKPNIFEEDLNRSYLWYLATELVIT